MTMKPIPLALTEAAIEKFRARDPRGKIQDDAVLDRMSAAMLAARVAAEQLATVAEAVNFDATLTPGQRALRLRESATKLGQKTTAKLDQAHAAAVTEIERLEAAMTPPAPATNHEGRLRAESRTRLEKMDPKARGEAITKAINTNNATVCGAIFEAGISGWFIGISDAELAVRRNTWHQAAFPERFDRVGRLRKALEALDRGASAFVGLVGAAASSPEALAANASVERTAAATAAAAAAE